MNALNTPDGIAFPVLTYKKESQDSAPVISLMERLQKFPKTIRVLLIVAGVSWFPIAFYFGTEYAFITVFTMAGLANLYSILKTPFQKKNERAGGYFYPTNHKLYFSNATLVLAGGKQKIFLLNEIEALTIRYAGIQYGIGMFENATHIEFKHEGEKYSIPIQLDSDYRKKQMVDILKEWYKKGILFTETNASQKLFLLEPISEVEDSIQKLINEIGDS